MSDTVFPQTVTVDAISKTIAGLTKRELFAVMILQSIISSCATVAVLGKDQKYNVSADKIKDAIGLADIMLTELTK